MRRDVLAALLGLGGGAAAVFVACGFDPRRPFDRYAPEVDRAVAALDAGQSKLAAERLNAYLHATGCDGGVLMAPAAADAADAAFDLGLSLFELAEQFGHRFRDPPGAPPAAGAPPKEQEDPQAALRRDHVDCARSLLDSILQQPLAPEVQARARYLRGNLAYLDRRWEAAIEDYDRALRLLPGLEGDAGDRVGRDAAWNRALALHHKEREKQNDAGNDASEPPDASPDGGNDAGRDAQPDAQSDAPPDAQSDGGKDQKPDGQDGGGRLDASSPPPPEPKASNGANGAPPPPASAPAPAGASSAPAPGAPNQDDRMLDTFEQAPTWQKEEAKSRNAGRRVRGTADK